MKVDLKALIGDLNKPDGPENYRARLRLRNETARVGGKGQEEERKEFAAALAKAVVESHGREQRRGGLPQQPPANRGMRDELLRSLCEIAGAAEVSVLMPLVENSEERDNSRRAIAEDVDVRDFVRRAIECIPGDEATVALAQMAVKGAGTEFRIGAINALGKRKNAEAMKALQACAADPDPRIRLAAADALSNIGDPSAMPAIGQSFDPNRGWAPHANAARTQLRLASNVGKTGNKQAADQIYRSVGAQAEPYQVKAAQIGVQQPLPRR
jgi:hypothetical protein